MQRFSGPMAKQHCMALLTVGVVVAAMVPQWGESIFTLILAAILIGAGTTCIHRTRQIIRDLSSGEPS